jgi:hypothetical protein
VVSLPGNPGIEEPSPGTDTCWILAELNGGFSRRAAICEELNVSERSIIGRDINTFIAQKRDCVHRFTLALTPNVTIERDLLLRPRDRKQLGHASISTTLNIYTHVVDASHRSAVELVEERLFTELDPNGPKLAIVPETGTPVSARSA